MVDVWDYNYLNVTGHSTSNFEEVKTTERINNSSEVENQWDESTKKTEKNKLIALSSSKLPKNRQRYRSTWRQRRIITW